MTASALPHEAGTEPIRRGRLALALQEALTTICRLRANRQTAADAESFRSHLKQLLGAADQEARRAGYSSEDVKLAIYAVVVFVDESVLNSSLPMFAEWPRRPLQEEIFGGHTGGEAFFQQLGELAKRQDSDDLSDLLEVYQLCLLLGFKGRYSLGGGHELRTVMGAIADKIRRIRGPENKLAPAAPLPHGEKIPVAADPWVRRLVIIAGATVVVAILVYVLFSVSLGSAAAGLQGS